jgi:DNA-binding transcriptional MerR regulator
MSEAEPRSIGAVINLLKDEFPDITVSKVRFLESQGLISPRRSASGYRIFYDEDIKRLRFILQQQRDHYLPLKVIKARLTMWERGEEPPLTPPSDTHPEAFFARSDFALDREELARAAGLSPRQIDDLVSLGLLHPGKENGRTTFRESDVVVATQAQRLLAYGLEVRHLRTLLLGTEKASALLQQLTSPLFRHHSPDSRRRAAETLAGCADAINRLQAALLTEELRRLLED